MTERAREVPTVADDGTLQRLSVSTIKKFRECERKFWFSKVKHVEEPQHKAAAEGVAGHARCERTLRTGDDVLGPIERAGKHLWPAPGTPGLLLEHPISWSVAGVRVTGFVDVLWRAGSGMVIADHKFTGDIEAPWQAQQPGDLIDVERSGHAIQMIGYAAAALTRWPVLADFDVRHWQYQTRGARRAREVRALVSARQVLEQWAIVESWIPRMREVARATEIRAVRPTWSACRICPFQTYCLRAQAGQPLVFPPSTKIPVLLSTAKPAVPRQEIKTMGLMDRVLKAAVPAPAAVAQPLTAPACAGCSGPLPEGREKICHQCSPPAPLSMADTAPPAAPAPAAAVLPPDAPPSNPALAADPLTPEMAQQLGVATPAPAPAAEPAAPKRGPGRPRKAPAAPPAPASATPAPAQGSATIDAPAPVLAVYVDALPSAPVQPLAPYVAARVAELAAHFQVPDIRTAGTDSPIGYGKWAGTLAAHVRANPPEPGAYYASSAGEFARTVIEALEPMAAVFVRGVRA